MHFPDDHAPDADPMALALAAVKEAARSVCHLAGVVGRAAQPGERGDAEAALALEAGLEASRALFVLEDALQRGPSSRIPMSEALGALHASEAALRAARNALEARVARTLRPETRARLPMNHG